jgi:hypothetical protein
MSSKTPVPASQVAEVQVILNKPHSHRGGQFKAGEKINVNAKEKAWLEKRGIVGGQQEEVNHG